jgi:hypothetical protein
MVSIVINSTTTNITKHANSTISHIASKPTIFNAEYIVIGLILIGVFALIFYLLKKYSKPKTNKISADIYFQNLGRDLHNDLEFNTYKKRLYLNLVQYNKKYRVKSFKTETLKPIQNKIHKKQDSKDIDNKDIDNKDIDIKPKTLYIIELSKPIELKKGFKYRYLFLTDIVRMDNRNTIELQYYKSVNNYSLKDNFILEADSLIETMNYLEEIGLFRRSYTNLLNNLEKSRIQERVVENNSLADNIKSSEVQKNNFLETYKQIGEYKKI